MKKITTLFVFLTALTLMSQAQLINPITIDSARTNDGSGVPVDTGVRVTLTGTVYGVNSYKYAGGLIFTLNDHVAGIKVYATHDYQYTVHEGDSVQVTGTLSFFKGQEEIDPNRTLAGDTILYLGQSAMDTTVVSSITETNESQLIELLNVNMTTATGWAHQAPYSDFSVHPIGTSYSIYIDSFVSPALYNLSAPLTGMYNVLGIGAQFKSAAPFTSGYQIVPRYPSDFQSLSGVGVKNVEGKLSAVVYPNPASTKVMVSLMNDREETLTAQLLDVTGRVVMSETKTVTNGENNLEFNTANVINGMYVLELRTAEKYLNTKIIVTK